MKRSFKSITVIALLCSTAIAMAKAPNMELKVSKNSKSVVLTVTDAQRDMRFTIVDAQGHVLYAETLAEGDRSTKFDLQQLEDGTYFMKTEHDLQTIVYTLSIKGDTVTVMGRNERTKPFFRRDGGRVFMNFLNLDRSDVHIKVYDADYRLLYAETVEKEINIEKAFNFSGAYAGSYTVRVADDNEVFAKTFVVK